jgi:hypothetical protein
MKILSHFAAALAASAALFLGSVTMAYDPWGQQAISLYSTDWVVEQTTPYGYSAAWKSGADQPIVNVAAASPAKPRFRGYGEAAVISQSTFPGHKPVAYGQRVDRSKIMALDR